MNQQDDSTTRDDAFGRADVAAVLLLAGLVASVYGVCVTGVVAHTDDYWLLWQWRREPQSVIDIWNAAGRWATGLLFQVSWWKVDRIGELWQPRLFSLLGIGFFASSVYATLRRLRYSKEFSFGLSALGMLLPTFAVYAAWATCSGHIFACLIALAAFWWADSTADLRTGWTALFRMTLAAAALFVGLSIYQPAGMFYVAALMFLVASDTLRDWTAAHTARLLRHAGVLFVALVAGFVVARMSAREAGAFDLAERSAFTSGPIHKLGRFVLQPVGQSLFGCFFTNDLPRPTMLTALVVAFVLMSCGIFWRFSGSVRTRLGRMALLATLIPLSYAPNLLISSDFFPYRTRPAIAIAILLLMLLAAAGWLRRFIADERLRRRITQAGLLITICVFAAVIRYHIHAGFVRPGAIEWQTVCEEVKNAAQNEPRAPQSIVFLAPSSDRPLARRFIYDEFGYVNASPPWVAEGLTGLAVVEVAPNRLADYEQAKFIRVPPGSDPPDLSGPVWIIDARYESRD